MDSLTFLHLQMRLEGKVVVYHRFIRQVENVPGEEIPLVLLAQLTGRDVITYYDEAISSDLQQELAEVISETPFPNVNPILRVLQRRNIRFEMGHYKTYTFSYQPKTDQDILCFSKDDPRVKIFGFDGFAESIYAIEREEKLVSACVSARENERCGEAWVYTDPGYRHQGFAQKTVRAWASHLMENGKVPFYSHKIENTPSANLARRLGLQPLFEEIAITQR